MQPTALLIKVASIQRYIFSSNKLKENIGASHIIEHELFEKCSPAIKEDNIIFIGGGNAMYKFDSENEARTFLNAFSLNALCHFPGIRLDAAMDKYDTNFKETRSRLTKLLRSNKSLYPSMGVLPKDGVFADCPQTNEYQEVSDGNDAMISFVSKVKFEACKRAQMRKNNRLNHEKFVFTDEIEKLGQQKDKGYIAVVHIDGNNIGQQFNKIKEEAPFVELSDKVRAYANDAMEALINDIIRLFSETDLREEIILDKDEDGKSILPIRPILTGGDDITFVCEGRLGIYLAGQFIRLFEQIANKENKPNDASITACAGIAIVKTKFPFFKAYKLAEELCLEAKVNSRPKRDSWISFHCSSQGVSGDLKKIRAAELESANGLLTANPYSLDVNHPNGLENLKSMAGKLKCKWPKNKIMELRDVVKQSESRQTLFREELKYRGNVLPEFAIWQDKKTKYWDAIQLLDFYPQTLLK